jgi:hypothetical protein
VGTVCFERMSEDCANQSAGSNFDFDDGSSPLDPGDAAAAEKRGGRSASGTRFEISLGGLQNDRDL